MTAQQIKFITEHYKSEDVTKIRVTTATREFYTDINTFKFYCDGTLVEFEEDLDGLSVTIQTEAIEETWILEAGK